MKYVYVLTSTAKDLYYEQALISAYSLRKKMPNSQIVFLVDDNTEKSFTEENKRLALKKYASQVISVNFDENIPNIDRSRLLKTTIPEYIDGSFLYRL